MLTNEQFQILCEIILRQTQAFERLAQAVEKIAPAVPDQAPNYQFALEQFKTFDWSTIGAEVERQDNYGAAIVNWRRQQYIRRSPSNKYGEAVWFSRCVGKTEDGENKYIRLCTFKPTKSRTVEPLPEKVQRLTNVEVEPSADAPPPLWQTWRDAKDGIQWARQQLPSYSENKLWEIMNSLQPDASGQKRVIFYNHINSLKSKEYGLKQPAAPTI